jgi:hypothetical protein
MEELKPNIPESKYAPLNLEEFQQLSKVLSEVGNYLPEHHMGYMWMMCTRLRGTRENQPCSCRSSAGLWARCVDELKQFVNQKNEQNS